MLALGESAPTLPSICVSGSAPGEELAARFYAFFAAVPPIAVTAGFAAMLLAMMPPLLSGPLLHVWRRSLSRRQFRAVALFMMGYGLTWLAAGVPLIAMSLLLRSVAADVNWSPAAFGIPVALAWQVTPLKQISLNRCHGRPPLAAFGFRAEVDALAYGAGHGVWCVGACWALMLVPLSASGLLHWTAMVPVMLISIVERVRAPQLPRWRAALPRLQLPLWAISKHMERTA